MKKWLLVFCRPRQDGVAVSNLQRQGFTVYSPQIEVRPPQVTAHAASRTEPLFPRYVFINVDPQLQSVAPVRSTKGVLGFVRFGAEYACASQEIIDRIECNVALHAARMSDASVFRRGELVKINGSSFSDIDGVFCNPCGKQRAMVLLNVLGAETRVSVPLSFVSRAESRLTFDHLG